MLPLKKLLTGLKVNVEKTKVIESRVWGDIKTELCKVRLLGYYIFDTFSAILRLSCTCTCRKPPPNPKSLTTFSHALGGIPFLTVARQLAVSGTAIRADPTFETDNIVHVNIEQEMKEMQKIILSWSSRNITQYGKVIIIKSFLISKVADVLLYLPTPKPIHILKSPLMWRVFCRT